jgi:hypothetical protein
MRVNGNIVLNDNGSGEIRQVYIERLATAAETTVASTQTAANTGRLIFNTDTKQYKYWNGVAFIPFASGTDATSIQSELDRLETSMGNFINADGSFTPTALDALMAINLTGATSLVDVLVKLDQAITNIDVSSQIAPIKTEIDAIEAGAGLSTTGTYVVPTTSTYLNTSTSLANADAKLDVALKAQVDKEAAYQVSNDAALVAAAGVTTSLQAEVDRIETAAGLAADGTFVAPTGTTYLGSATSLKDGEVKLDVAIKTNTDGLSALTTVVAGKQAALGYVPVNKVGDSMTGNLAFDGTHTVTGIAAPVNSLDAVRKIDLDNAVASIARDFQADVLGNEADYVATPGRYIFGTGSKFTKGATGAVAGDIVVVDAVGVVTSVAYAATAAGPGALAWNRTSSTWNQWNGTVWSDFGGLSGVNAGIGLTKAGNTISVALGAGIANLPTGEVGVDLKAAGGLQLVNPTTGVASTATDAVLAAKVTGGLEVVANGIQVKAAGITEVELAASVAGNGLVGGAGTALSVNVGSGLLITADAVVVDQAPLDAKFLKLAGGTLTGALVLAADAVAPLQATTLEQVQAGDAASAAALSTAVTTINTKFSSVVASLNKTYFEFDYVTTGATAAITVVHNLGVKYCNVSVIDDTDEVFIPQSIKFIDANTLQVTLNTDISGKVVVMGHATLTLA